MPVRRPPPAAIGAILTAAAVRAGIPPALLISVAHAESRYDPRAVSPAGAMGLLQLMPRTAQALGVTEPFNPEQSARGGAQFLARLYAKYQNWPKALAAYNWGPGNVNRRPKPEQWPSATRRYIARILGEPIDPTARPQPSPRPRPGRPGRPRTDAGPAVAVAVLAALGLAAAPARR